MDAESPLAIRRASLKTDPQRLSRAVRATCMTMAFNGREGHLTSAMSCVDILVSLYGGWLNVSPKALRDPDRDRFLFSKGHAASAYYAVLAEAGFIAKDELLTYGKVGSRLPSHPCRELLPCLEMSSGSLGHGLGMGTGMLYGMQVAGRKGRVVVLMSDGECNEGSVWEAAAFATAQKLDRLVAIVDNNNMQAVGRTDRLMGYASLDEKFNAFGWAARTVDGLDPDDLRETLDDLPFVPGRPSAIIAKTVGGAGISFMEDQTAWHYRVPSREDLERALAELGESAMVGPLS